MASLKQKVIHGVFWRMLEQFGTQAIAFAVSIVLARVLGPEEFGTVALLTIFLSLSQCLRRARLTHVYIFFEFKVRDALLSGGIIMDSK